MLLNTKCRTRRSLGRVPARGGRGKLPEGGLGQFSYDCTAHLPDEMLFFGDRRSVAVQSSAGNRQALSGAVDLLFRELEVQMQEYCRRTDALAYPLFADTLKA